MKENKVNIVYLFRVGVFGLNYVI